MFARSDEVIIEEVADIKILSQPLKFTILDLI